ncbi:MAG: hypothetical protein V3V78_03225 [Candidatus Woesearchaeota archaeon]
MTGNLTEMNIDYTNLVKKRNFNEHGPVVLTAIYHPMVQHSEGFCSLTHDSNKIHHDHPKYYDTISPGFLQASVANLLIAEAMSYVDLEAVDYVFSYDFSKMEKPVITGADYKFEISLHAEQEKEEQQKGAFSVSAKLTNGEGDLVYVLDKTFYKAAGENFFPELDLNKYIHSSEFSSDGRFRILSSGRPIGSTILETNLLALSASSSVICDAIKEGNLRKIPEDPQDQTKNLVAMYDQQEVHAYACSNLDLREGVTLDLYISDRFRFGKFTKPGETLDMKIVGRESNGRILYTSTAPLSFPKAKGIDTLLKQEIRKRMKEREEPQEDKIQAFFSQMKEEAVKE